MQAPDRSIFLHPPGPGMEKPLKNPYDLLRRIAEEITKWIFPPDMPQEEWDGYLLREATSSAVIENEYQELQIEKHRRSLAAYIGKPRTEASLLELHRGMMQDKPLAQPGRYRSVGVTVGRYSPPTPALVPPLMEELFSYLQERNHDPLFQAAWAHIQFETIHPFADGNGRTGRALINQILGIPLPISEEILRSRQNYYRLLDSGNWDEYFEWFLRITVEKAAREMSQIMFKDGQRGHR